MKLIKKLARKILFSKKKVTTNVKPFTTAPSTSANAVTDPVISFSQPKVGGHDIDDKPKLETCIDKTPVKKNPGRPKGQTKSAPAKKSANNSANKSKAKPKPKAAN